MAKAVNAPIETPPQPVVVVESTEAAPAPSDGGQKNFVVSYGEKSHTVTARDSIEAWAVFCDYIKAHPSPKAGKIDGDKAVGFEHAKK